MSKKIIVTLSITLSILLLVLVGYYFMTRGNSDGGGGIVSGFKNFFPFGGDGSTSSTTTPTPTPDPENEQEQIIDFTKKLRKLSIEPVSGAGSLDVSAGSLVRYIEKATGHIYEVELFSPNKSRISNTTIPVVYDAVWGNKNTSLITRYLRDDNMTVDTYSITLKNVSSTTDNTITGIPFPAQISDVSAFGATMFYLEQNEAFSAGYTSNFDGSKRKQVWSSPIKELNSQFVNERTVALTTKPYPNVNGYLYLVDTTSGNVKNVLRDIPGLSALVSPDLNQILYLRQNSSAFLSIFNQKDKLDQEIDFSTFPEKCVWSKKDTNTIFCAVPGGFIGQNGMTNWYKGLVSYVDSIYKYNIKDRTSTLLSNLEDDSSEEIDVVKPLLTENEQFLIFINKKDNTLWSLDLTK